MIKYCLPGLMPLLFQRNVFLANIVIIVMRQSLLKRYEIFIKQLYKYIHIYTKSVKNWTFYGPVIWCTLKLLSKVYAGGHEILIIIWYKTSISCVSRISQRFLFMNAKPCKTFIKTNRRKWYKLARHLLNDSLPFDVSS